MIQFSMCQEHNLQEDVLIRPDQSKSEQKMVCQQCANIFYGTLPDQQVLDSNIELIEIFESQAKQNSMKMNQIIDSLISMKELLNKKIESVIFEILNQMSNLDDRLKECKNNILDQPKIQQMHEEYITNLKIIQNKTIKDIEILQEKCSFNQNIIRLQELDSSSLNNKIKVVSMKQSSMSSQIDLSENKNERKRYLYQLTAIHARKFSEWEQCCAIALNKDASIAVAGFEKRIRVYEFKNEQLKEVQELEGFCVSKLQFINNSTQLVAISYNNIKIWQQQENQQWVIINELEYSYGTSVGISTINEDQIIYTELSIVNGTNFICFQKSQDNNKWIEYQRIEHSKKIESLSVNNSNTKLIVSEYQNLIKTKEIDKKIFVYEYNQFRWNISQQIIVLDQQLRLCLCFISEKEFVYFGNLIQELYLYSCNNANEMFEQINNSQIKNGMDNDLGYPLQFIKSKKILMVINPQFVNILRQENNRFILDQSIQFKTQKICGSISDDGQYLLTLNQDSCELQIRKLQMMQ